MILRQLGRASYQNVFDEMRRFTLERNEKTPDELWLCEHDSIYTQGIAGNSEHLLKSSTGIAVIQTDRGGQITYHGPGQIVAYPLIDLRRQPYFIKDYVRRLEEAVLLTLLDFGIQGERVSGAPGIYVSIPKDVAHAPTSTENEGISAVDPRFAKLAKIAALGIKVSRQCAYHGLALNVDVDLAPFSAINPCGYSRLKTLGMAHLGVIQSQGVIAASLVKHLNDCLYNTVMPDHRKID